MSQRRSKTTNLGINAESLVIHQLPEVYQQRNGAYQHKLSIKGAGQINTIALWLSMHKSSYFSTRCPSLMILQITYYLSLKT
ncbi:hypothetical protein VTP01DRAFT_1571 [Rhizomucor pusillus]|uniref:uncharacterized protein n=1 Tax=Rhizomucor pusillus TaxID=4840 RepID=UPI003742BAE2